MSVLSLTATRAFWQTRIRKRPLVLSHAINSRCNMKCDFCEYWKQNDAEMTLKEIMRLLDEAKDFGIMIYNAWTVEPLLRDDLPHILLHAKELGIVTFLITNGLLLEKRAEELKDLDYLSVSVDGINSYREIRGVDFKTKILPGIIKAKRYIKNPILMNCVLSGRNLDDIEELIRLAAELDVTVAFEPMYEFSDIADDVWQNIGVRDVDKYRRTVDMITEMKKEGYPIINSYTYLKMVRDMNTDFRCHAGELILNVTADGTIEHCRVQNEALGNVKEGLEKVWENSREKRKQIAHTCHGCLFFGYVENSLLYDMNLEVMRHYKWM
ncbi:putative Fe-S oxidoreductase [Methanomethylovorans hollandica DSM 15978]|uniref:Putative Fe-S oxidoreductase n=1 Tax=Methanomethylovorans hollandica (strain DSM 15978 / NBRC 107637 / DMS1) TaxID=867904 RepID=L0L0M2_METHD|nr:radical SAM protein [Methanomethylovorans hollandica]AGB50500.1 putative Fe-S oxidoreductase [Methanomethylovorans hollandica DSM 15978]